MTPEPSINMLANKGDAAGVERLLRAGIPVDFIDNGRAKTTPLQEAACAGHVDVVRLLIAAGANVSHVDIDGFSPAGEAARNRHWEVVFLLAEAGANLDEINASGFTARHYIAKRCGIRWKRRLAPWIGPIGSDPAEDK